MVEVVDSIVAELIARVDSYVTNFDKATAAHERFLKSSDKLKAGAFDLNAEGAKYKAGSNAIEQAEEATTARVGRTRKVRTDTSIANDEREVASAKKAARAKADAAIAEEQREAAARSRISAMVDRSVAGRQRAPLTAAESAAIDARRQAAADARTAGLTSGQRSIPLAYLNGVGATEGVAAAAAETEINHLLADQFDLQQRIKAASGSQKRELQDQLELLRRLNAYKAAGLSEDESAVRAEKEIVALEISRSAAVRRRIAAEAGRFVEGVGLGRTGGSSSAVTGLVTAAAVAIGADIIQKAADYGNELATVSKELGITTLQLQTFQAVARETGVSNEQLTTGLGQLAANLGKAKEGGQQQSKIFQALGIDISKVSSAGELLPTLIDRISSIKDESKRASIETLLFGEAGRKLDGLLSGGNQRVNELAQSLIDTGHALSDPEIKRLDETSRKIASLKAELGVDISKIVAANADGIEKMATALKRVTAAVVGFLGSHPETALALLGAFVGLRSGGPLGAAVGALAGYGFGHNLQESAERAANDANTDPKFRARQVRAGAAAIGTIEGMSDQEVRRKYLGASKKTILAAVVAEERRQIGLADGVLGTDPKTASVQDGSVDNNLLSKLLAPKGPKGPKGKSADQLGREADQRTKRFIDTIGRFYDEQEAAVSEQTQDEYERARLKKEQIERDRDRAIEDLKLQADEDIRNGADKKLTNARLGQAITAERNAAAEKLNVVSLEDTLEALKRTYDTQIRQLDVQQGILEDQLARATTEKERRRIALALLAIERQKETIGANFTLAKADQGDPSVSTSDVNAAQSTLATQDKRFELKTSVTNQQHLSPLDAYRRQLHEATDDTNAALQSIAVSGLGKLEDQLANTIGHVLGLKGAFGDLVSSVLTDLAKIELEKGFLELLGGGTGSSSDKSKGGGLGGFFTSVIGAIFGSVGGGGALSGAAKSGGGSGGGSFINSILGGRASGGPVVAGGRYVVGEDGPEVVQFNAAGRVFPNGKLPNIGSGQGVALHQTFHIDASGVNPNGYAEGIITQVRRETASAIRASGQVVLNATPARVVRQQTLGT